VIKVGLLSDTHGFLHPKLPDLFSGCDEIWHAGDIGNPETLYELRKIKPVRAVYGNIDGYPLTKILPVKEVFQCENIKVLMTHIGGYPGKYERNIRQIIIDLKPGLFISGHSHILKVIYDKKYKLLHINPGAAGKIGMHKVITLIRFTAEGDKISNLEIIELEQRNKV